MTKLDLPNYKDQSHEVKARFDDLKQRDVILDVKHLGKIFDSAKGPVTALEDINLQVHRREFVTVIGPSGCGKSTLGRAILRLVNFTEGTVSWLGRDLGSLSKNSVIEAALKRTPEARFQTFSLLNS